MTVCFYIRLSSADDDIRLKAESDSVSNQRALLAIYSSGERMPSVKSSYSRSRFALRLFICMDNL